MRTQQFVERMSAPLEVSGFTPEEANLAWLRLRVFERILLKFSINLLFPAFIFGMISWWIPGIGCVILASCLLIMHFWFVQVVFSFRRLLDIVSVHEKASKYAKNHLYGVVMQVGCFLIICLFAFGSWMEAHK